MPKESKTATDPLELKWEYAGELGKEWPQETVYVFAIDEPNDKAWIIFKEIPLRLARHIVAVHNARFNHD